MKKLVRLIWILFAAFVIYSTMDALQTNALLKINYTEVNPLINLAMYKFGRPWGLFIVKASSFLIVFLCIKSTIKSVYKENTRTRY